MNKPSLSQPVQPPQPSPTLDSAEAKPASPGVTVAEGMRFYEAILGRAPVVDPDAPDLLPHLRDDEPPAAGWRQEMSRQVRDELARGVGARLNVRFQGRPTWRQLAEAMTGVAGRHLQEARRRLSGEDRLGLPKRPAGREEADVRPSMRMAGSQNAVTARPRTRSVSRLAERKAA